MKRPAPAIGTFALVLSAAVIAACSPVPAGSPTPDVELNGTYTVPVY